MSQVKGEVIRQRQDRKCPWAAILITKISVADNRLGISSQWYQWRQYDAVLVARHTERLQAANMRQQFVLQLPQHSVITRRISGHSYVHQLLDVSEDNAFFPPISMVIN